MRFEAYDEKNVPPFVRHSQRLFLLHLTNGEEMWAACAYAVGLEPALDVDRALEIKLVRLAMRWLADPEVEEFTEEVDRAAASAARLLRLRAIHNMAQFMASPIEKMKYTASRDVYRVTAELGSARARGPREKGAIRIDEVARKRKERQIQARMSICGRTER